MIKLITSASEFATTINAPSLTVVEYYATWCGPCKAIAPFVDTLSTRYTSATFIKVDVDQSKDIAQAYNITGMPTFQLFRSGKKVGVLNGANPQQLEMLITKHLQEDAANKAPKAPYIPSGYRDISDQVDLTALDCLNEKPNKTIKNMFKGTSTLESDVDEQLMINVTFNQVVKLHSIKFVSSSIETAPKTIKLFVNRIGMGFDTVDSVEPTQVLELTESDFADNKATSLRFVKFQTVTSLSIFIEDNQDGGEVTILRDFKFIGLSQDTTDMSALKKQDH